MSNHENQGSQAIGPDSLAMLYSSGEDTRATALVKNGFWASVEISEPVKGVVDDPEKIAKLFVGRLPVQIEKAA